MNVGDPLRVLLFTRGNFYLESVLAAMPNLDLVKRVWSSSDDLARLARLHDVVVLDGISAPKLPPGNFLLVNTGAPGLPFTDAGEVARPAILGHGAQRACGLRRMSEFMAGDSFLLCLRR